MPSLKLALRDVNDRVLGEQSDVMLRRQSTGQMSVVQTKPGKTLNIQGLASDVYSVQVDPPSYLSAGAFAMVTPGGADLAMTFPVDPRKVKKVVFPAFAALGGDAKRVLTATEALLGFPNLSGKNLYDPLDDIRKAGLLNIFAKSGWTPLTNGRTVSSYIVKLLELRGDRFFSVVPQELREETKNSVQAGMFREVPEMLHHPPPGFDHAGSFKSLDHYGNIQLTFFANGTDWVADIDIDEADGLRHLFQVVEDELTNRPTHPYDIHEILIKYQKLDPGYQLVV
jgi:hypothetical protein